MVLDRQAAPEENPLAMRELPVPEPGLGHLRVRVSVCAVCHTDLHIVEGDLPLRKQPVIPGHQIVGVVDALGQGAAGFKEGDRVGIPWLHWTDGDCGYCRRNSENLCERAKFTGWDVDGGYAEYVVAPADFVYRLPKSCSDEHAAPLLCAGIIGYRSYRLSNAKKGERLGLYGFGASAHIVLQFARHLGNECYVFTRTPEHAELAKKLGAVWTGRAEEQPPSQLDCAIVFAPAGHIVPLALRAVRKGGTVACAGITMSPIPQLDYADLYHERILRSVANSTRQDAREFLELAAEVPVRTEIELFPLEQANLAIAAMKHSRVRGAAVLKL
ncbi:MAG TPA: zinc-dependent alcohol dehydrogenase family protein [Terriglobales bacterium]|nr:zinc-dependent alcohol dehydrogenase family protein [Terriglobales bacterium]